MNTQPPKGSVKSNVFRAVHGTYEFTPLSIIQKPGTVALFHVKFSNFGSYQTMPSKQKIDFLSDSDPYLIVVYARKCATGERYTEEYTCEACPAGQSTDRPQTEEDNFKSCDFCLSFGKCEGRGIYPDKGFVRMSHK